VNQVIDLMQYDMLQYSQSPANLKELRTATTELENTK
jgi:hypothetical protein